MKEGKMRKFADTQASKQRTDNQTNVSTTESTLILSGYSRELANINILRRGMHFIFLCH